MGKKNDGAASATGTTKKAPRTNTEMKKANNAAEVKTYTKLSKVLEAFEKIEQPRGAKFSIGDKATRLVTANRGGEKTYFTFEGTPAEFAAALLKTSGIRSEVISGSSTAPASTDDGE